jgi:hypothetical protein
MYEAGHLASMTEGQLGRLQLMQLQQKQAAVAEARTREFKVLAETAWKSVSDEGEFEGLCAVYNEKDQQSDVLVPGALARSLKDQQLFPLLWQHDPKEVIGIGELEDSREGLKIRGRLNLNVARAREVHALMKQLAVRGLSIGYDTIRSIFKAGARHLEEIKLWEVSLVTFPAQPLAVVESVKAMGSPETYTTLSFKSLFTDMRSDLADRKERSVQRQRDQVAAESEELARQTREEMRAAGIQVV